MNNNYRLPSEWEQQSAIALIWPDKNTDWNAYLDEITETYIQLAMIITNYERLLVISPNVEDTKSLLKKRLTDNNFNRIVFSFCENNDTWARDVLPITLVPSCNASNKESLFLDFKFNGWGKKFKYDKDNKLNRKIFSQSVLNGKIVNCKDFILEGGSIETDGKGTLFTTSSCLLAPNRNELMSKQKIEEKLLDIFDSIKRIIWIEHGALRGDDTDGHIDTILRCAPNNTLLYIATEDKLDDHFDDLNKLDKQVRSLRTLDNKPYRFLPLILPKPIYYNGERLPATYANFLILNGAVIVPTYRQKNNDTNALSIIKKAFPNHDIIGVDASVIIRQHGSIHCLTMQLPKGCLK